MSHRFRCFRRPVIFVDGTSRHFHHWDVPSFSSFLMSHHFHHFQCPIIFIIIFVVFNVPSSRRSVIFIVFGVPSFSSILIIEKLKTSFIPIICRITFVLAHGSLPSHVNQFFLAFGYVIRIFSTEQLLYSIVAVKTVVK